MNLWPSLGLKSTHRAIVFSVVGNYQYSCLPVADYSRTPTSVRMFFSLSSLVFKKALYCFYTEWKNTIDAIWKYLATYVCNKNYFGNSSFSGSMEASPLWAWDKIRPSCPCKMYELTKMVSRWQRVYSVALDAVDAQPLSL